MWKADIHDGPSQSGSSRYLKNLFASIQGVPRVPCSALTYRLGGAILVIAPQSVNCKAGGVASQTAGAVGTAGTMSDALVGLGGEAAEKAAAPVAYAYSATSASLSFTASIQRGLPFDVAIVNGLAPALGGLLGGFGGGVGGAALGGLAGSEAPIVGNVTLAGAGGYFGALGGAAFGEKRRRFRCGRDSKTRGVESCL